MTGLSIIILGPSKVLGLQPSVTLMLAGMAFDGFFSAFTWIPIHPEMTEGVELDQQSKDNNFVSTNMIADKVSALYNMSFALSSILAPIIGGGLYDRVGFQTASDIMAFAALTLSIYYAYSVTIPFY